MFLDIIFFSCNTTISLILLTGYKDKSNSGCAIIIKVSNTNGRKHRDTNLGKFDNKWKESSTVRTFTVYRWGLHNLDSIIGVKSVLRILQHRWLKYRLYTVCNSPWIILYSTYSICNYQTWKIIAIVFRAFKYVEKN